MFDMGPIAYRSDLGQSCPPPANGVFDFSKVQSLLVALPAGVTGTVAHLAVHMPRPLAGSPYLACFEYYYRNGYAGYTITPDVVRKFISACDERDIDVSVQLADHLKAVGSAAFGMPDTTYSLSAFRNKIGNCIVHDSKMESLLLNVAVCVTVFSGQIPCSQMTINSIPCLALAWNGRIASTPPQSLDGVRLLPGIYKIIVTINSFVGSQYLTAAPPNAYFIGSEYSDLNSNPHARQFATRFANLYTVHLKQNFRADPTNNIAKQDLIDAFKYGAVIGIFGHGCPVAISYVDNQNSTQLFLSTDLPTAAGSLNDCRLVLFMGCDTAASPDPANVMAPASPAVIGRASITATAVNRGANVAVGFIGNVRSHGFSTHLADLLTGALDEDNEYLPIVEAVTTAARSSGLNVGCILVNSALQTDDEGITPPCYGKPYTLTRGYLNFANTPPTFTPL